MVPDGLGTALKPAWEPIILARKPLSERNVAANVLRWGTGALNIDGSRIEGEPDRPILVSDRRSGNIVYGDGLSGSQRVKRDREGEATAEACYTERGGVDFAMTPGPRGGDAKGRWPANLLLDEDAAALLDAQSGELTSGHPAGVKAGGRLNCYGAFAGGIPVTGYGDTGGASRFFYTAKADREDRDGSKHPTVKPTDLMRYLIRLVTPPGGLVVDPFMGSGTTVWAAREDGFRTIGVDREAESVADAIRRLRQGVLPFTQESPA